MPHDVFLSYSQSDKAIADAVCHRLEGASIRCWIAPRDVGYGRGWDEAIVQAIGESKLFVVIFSAAANSSRHVLNEVASALDAEVTVIPFRVENVEPTGGMALHLRRLHWLDALSKPLDAHIDRLIGSVRSNLSRASPDGDVLSAPSVPAQGEDAPVPPTSPSSVMKRPSRRGRIIAGSLVGLAALAALGMYGFNTLLYAPRNTPTNQQSALQQPVPYASPLPAPPAPALKPEPAPPPPAAPAPALPPPAPVLIDVLAKARTALANKDYAEAARQYQIAAKQGNAEGEGGLAYLYMNGWG